MAKTRKKKGASRSRSRSTKSRKTGSAKKKKAAKKKTTSPRRTSGKAKKVRKSVKKKTSGRRSSSARRPARRPKKSDAGPAAFGTVTVADVILERQFGGSPRSGSPGVILLGLDLGTRRTVLSASRGGHPVQLSRDVWPTLVGSPRPGVVVAGANRYVFGYDGVRYSQHVDLAWPVQDGVVHDMELCRKFVGHLRTRVDPDGRETIWTVLSVPVDSTAEQRSRMRQVVLGAFERVFVVPEPYLAAVGMLRESPDSLPEVSVASIASSLVVDIGNRSTRVCLLEGGFPKKNNYVHLERGGSFIDERVLSAAHVHCGLQLNVEMVRSIKEEQGFVPVTAEAVRTPRGPNTEPLDLVIALREACEELLVAVVDGIQELVERCAADSLADLTENLLLTGRSSRIPGMKVQLGLLLEARGLGQVRVLVPPDHERLVARGALLVAEALGEEEWETAEQEQRRQDRQAAPETLEEVLTN